MRTSFPIFSGFIETGFEQRFQGLLRQAWRQRSWHVIVAEPGSGKSMGIRDLVDSCTHTRSAISGRSYPVLAVTAPKNDPKEAALGCSLMLSMNLPPHGRWSERKYSLPSVLKTYGVECFIIDDAHDLSMQHLIFVKELTDQLRLHYGYPVGLCLVAAGRGAAVPLKDILDQPETMWMQFRRRLDRVQPYCRIASHTKVEVRDILGTLERIYHPHFPALNLQQWTGSIYTWLTHPLLDPQTSGRVNMDGLMKLVTTALELSYAEGRQDVTAHALESAAQLLLLTRDNIPVIDAPATKKPQATSKEETATEPSVPRSKKRKSAQASQSETSLDPPLSDELGTKEPQLASKEETQVESSARPKKKRRTQASLKQVQASTNTGASDEERRKEVG